MAPFSISPSRSDDNTCREGNVKSCENAISFPLQTIIEHSSPSLPSRDGSILHRSLSTNATTCRNLNNLNAAHKNSLHSHESYESPKVQNMEEISLMSLEKDLKTLEEQNNNAIRRKSSKFQLSRFLPKRPNKFRN